MTRNEFLCFCLANARVVNVVAGKIVGIVEEEEEEEEEARLHRTLSHY